MSGALSASLLVMVLIQEWDCRGGSVSKSTYYSCRGIKGRQKNKWDVFKAGKSVVPGWQYFQFCCIHERCHIEGLNDSCASWLQRASKARQHVAGSKSLQGGPEVLGTWRSSPSCNWDLPRFGGARTMKYLPRKLQDGVKLAQERKYLYHRWQSWRMRLYKPFEIQRILLVLDARYRVSGFGVCFAGFQSCFGSTILCYALSHPFGRGLFILCCSLQEVTCFWPFFY